MKKKIKNRETLFLSFCLENYETTEFHAGPICLFDTKIWTNRVPKYQSYTLVLRIITPSGRNLGFIWARVCRLECYLGC